MTRPQQNQPRLGSARSPKYQKDRSAHAKKRHAALNAPPASRSPPLHTPTTGRPVRTTPSSRLAPACHGPCAGSRRRRTAPPVRPATSRAATSPSRKSIRSGCLPSVFLGVVKALVPNANPAPTHRNVLGAPLRREPPHARTRFRRRPPGNLSLGRTPCFAHTFMYQYSQVTRSYRLVAWRRLERHRLLLAGSPRAWHGRCAALRVA